MMFARSAGDPPCKKPTTGVAGCCARAASGHMAAASPINEMKSRRLIASPEAHEHRFKLAQPKGCWRGVEAQVSNDRLMSALGQKQTLEHVRFMSALPPKADIDRWRREGYFGPKAAANVRFFHGHR